MQLKFKYLRSESSRREAFLKTGEWPEQYPIVQLETTEIGESGRAAYLALLKICAHGQTVSGTYPLLDPERLAVSDYGYASTGRFKISDSSPLFTSDTDLTIDQAVTVLERLGAAIEALAARVDEKNAAALAEAEECQARRRQEEEERKARREKADRQREERERAEEEARERERATWIDEHGSAFLKKAVGAGYNCQRRYVTERAALELPGFVVDFDKQASWKDRSCPSEDALDRALELEAEGHRATVVWLTRDTFGEELSDEDLDTGWVDGREAIAIEAYLGKYTLVQ